MRGGSSGDRRQGWRRLPLITRALPARLAGHAWTIVPNLANRIWPREVGARPWSVRVPDDRWGAIRISGLMDARGNDALVVVLHGMGGTVISGYVRNAARAVAAAGLSCLRLSLRGADGSGEDVYHAGLTADLRAALACPEVARFEHIYLLGYSLGGHLALLAAIEGLDPRVRAVAAISPPLDLAAAQRSIDAPRLNVYRSYVLGNLKRQYRATAGRRALTASYDRVARIRRVREWDALVVVPRYGFADPEDYYARASVGPVIGGLQLPALIVASRVDPVISAWTLDPVLARAPAELRVLWVAGGHVFFPATTDLGLGAGPTTVDAGAIAWLIEQ